MQESATNSSSGDVRMRGFTSRTSLTTAQAWVDQHSSPLDAERVPLKELAGRVLAADVVSAIDVPAFERGMMDGWAVRAADIQGASPSTPLPLTIAGDALPARPFPRPLAHGEAVRIMTGAPLPVGADAVVPAEQSERDEGQVRVLGDVSPRKHVGFRGEDIRQGTVVLQQGRRLRPQDVGLLSSIGCAEAAVVRRPRLRIMATGNELLPAGTIPTGCLIADANTPMLEALATRDGGIVVHSGIVRDEPEEIRTAMFDDVDIVIVSGGSSVGMEDHAAEILEKCGELAIHGIAIRPAGPAGMGRIGTRIVFLLPGNPVSCLTAYDFFAGRAIRRLAGLPTEWPYCRIRAPLSRNLVSVAGRVDYARVRMVEGHVEPLAISGSSVLSSTTRADGFVVVPEGSEGYTAGAEVTVWLYDEPCRH